MVLTADGQVYQGIVTDKDNRRVVLKESTGALRTVPVNSIEEQKAGGSLMPKGLVNLMTHAEFVDLVRFLSELGRPGPYAIRTTPTIQRWRVLKAVPPRPWPIPSRTPRPSANRCSTPRPTAGPRSTPGSPAACPSTTRPPPPAAVRCSTSRASSTSRRRATSGSARPSPTAIRFWVDDVAAPIGTREFTASVTPGRHTVTVRVEVAERSHRELRIEVDKPAGLDGRVHRRRRQVKPALASAAQEG